LPAGTPSMKAKIGELLPAKTPKETGRGKKTSAPDALVFDKHAIAAYRKLAANVDSKRLTRK